jgi:SPW repeat
MLAEQWWFWAAMGALAVAIVATEPRWRSAGAALRAAAVERRLVAGPPGLTIEPGGEGRLSEPWLPAFLIGVWVCASPWIWGYDDVEGAIAADVVTGAAIALVSLAGVIFPAFLALNVLAGLWLTTAPWLVGFGTDSGPVGLSDTLAGLATIVLALRAMAAATRRLRSAHPGPIGRVPRR